MHGYDNGGLAAVSAGDAGQHITGGSAKEVHNVDMWENRNAIVALLLVIAVSIADLFLPLGITVWLGYLLALLIATRFARPRRLYLLVSVSSVLIALGLAFPQTSAQPPLTEIVDRLAGIGLLWLIAILRVQGLHAEETLPLRTAELSQAYEELQTLSRRLVEIQENERRALAQELHDEAGQALTSLKLGLGLMAREAGCPENVVAQVKEMQRQVDGVMDGLHRLAMNLRPPSLDRLGLVAAVRQYLEDLGRENGLVVQFEVLGLEESQLPPEVEASLYRVVQEGLTNVARHAQATRAGVILQRRGDSVLAIVEDNGVGLDLQRAKENGHLGLLGMEERTRMLGGRLNIESAPHEGTTVIAEIPCGTPARF